ncbi:Pyrophosphatase PpaX [bioreactor metagenome]|uniref:Pyrophosphatase PpaX n=1 Tax=bioreactor metagenome TaxID=1076179 RepID=A0A644X8S5_9ZZZZ
MKILIKHILFDFDGTIVGSLELALQILNEMAEKYHYQKVTMEDMQKLKYMPLTERFKQIGFPLHKIPAMTMECAAMYKKEIASLKPVEGIRDVISSLKEDGYSLSILSSNSMDNIAEFLRRNNLELFDHIYSANNLFGKDKSINKFINQFGLKKDEILYVGDEMRDIDACKRVGVKIVAVTWGYDPLSLLKSGNPDYIAETPEDIRKAVIDLKSS